jgi:hypothetical protein
MKNSLGREPRWNADRCAPLRAEARPWPMPRQNETLRLSAFRLRHFSFRSYPFVIHAKVALADASTGICLLQLRTEHRIKSVVTIYVSDVP